LVLKLERIRVVYDLCNIKHEGTFLAERPTDHDMTSLNIFHPTSVVDAKDKPHNSCNTSTFFYDTVTTA
jgi:hypothetical protein